MSELRLFADRCNCATPRMHGVTLFLSFPLLAPTLVRSLSLADTLSPRRERSPSPVPLSQPRAIHHPQSNANRADALSEEQKYRRPEHGWWRARSRWLRPLATPAVHAQRTGQAAGPMRTEAAAHVGVCIKCLHSVSVFVLSARVERSAVQQRPTKPVQRCAAADVENRGAMDSRVRRRRCTRPPAIAAAIQCASLVSLVPLVDQRRE